MDADTSSNVNCSDTNFEYPRPAKQKSGHTEPRIVETIFQGAAKGRVSGTLTMKIDWINTSTKNHSARVRAAMRCCAREKMRFED